MDLEVQHPQIEKGWYTLLKDEFEKAYFLQLKQFLLQEKCQYRVFPPGNRIFAAFNQTPLHSLKVVIIGQDPYHSFGQANGLCFSVADGVKQPPSLQNIFKELKSDLGIEPPKSGNLDKWSAQGILLLNAILTVRENLPSSHKGKGWELFTDTVIRKISESKQGIVFLLWGNFAQSKASLINQKEHFVLTAPHPSPLARGGFFGCKHFSKTNELLLKQGNQPINWQL